MARLFIRPSLNNNDINDNRSDDNHSNDNHDILLN